MTRVPLLVLLALVAVSGANAASSHTIRGNGVTLSLPAGWYGLVGRAGVQAADFPLPQRARSSADLVQVRRGHVHLVVFNYGPRVPYLPFYRAARTPLKIRLRDLLRGGLEGFGSADTYGIRNATLGGQMLEVVADLGPKPFRRSSLRKVNGVLETLRVLPPRVLLPQHGRLEADGVSLRLLQGWSGRVEIPAERYGARVVLRAARGDLRLILLETTEAPTGDHVSLPLFLTTRNVIHRYSPPLARRVFSNGGRVFDLSVTVPSPGALREANRLLSTLRVAPRPWTFRSCDLTLRLPGTWRAGIRPRSGCFPLLKLRGPGALVVLSELRSGEQASGRILRRAHRRFEIEVVPRSARARADAVLATLRAEPRS